ncbi:hypothetical protein QL919_06250 [Psychrobacter sp. APC 3426]|uniref:hypothetical protein n=1 Tax=Psychrobacter sp. APC 3426 TaxID=3035177 RepID=UPI0025B36D09|nr:hypothetical protein [Psychrobacter sp. APC 3426]MDN3398328.1 hypothetical protein [Psychrobacter sp. APC 3426]
MQNHMTIIKAWLSIRQQPFIKPLLFSLPLTLALASCSYMPDITMPDSHTTTPTQPNTSTHQPPAGVFSQCPPFNPANTICTAQYDPVCVKTQTGSVISYRTAGNACSACSTPEAVAYVKGECL